MEKIPVQVNNFPVQVKKIPVQVNNFPVQMKKIVGRLKKSWADEKNHGQMEKFPEQMEKIQVNGKLFWE